MQDAHRKLIETIPPELHGLKRFCLWKLEAKQDGTKPSKVPYSPNGRKASSTDPSTWATLPECVAALTSKYKCLGIFLGYVPEVRKTLCGNDYDHVRQNTGNILQWAAHSLTHIDDLFGGTWTNNSQSGEGLKILFWQDGEPAPSFRGTHLEGGSFEHYEQDRFFALTPNNLPGTPLVLATLPSTFFDYLRPQLFNQSESRPSVDTKSLPSYDAAATRILEGELIDALVDINATYKLAGEDLVHLASLRDKQKRSDIEQAVLKAEATVTRTSAGHSLELKTSELPGYDETLEYIRKELPPSIDTPTAKREGIQREFCGDTAFIKQIRAARQRDFAGIDLLNIAKALGAEARPPWKSLTEIKRKVFDVSTRFGRDAISRPDGSELGELPTAEQSAVGVVQCNAKLFLKRQVEEQRPFPLDIFPPRFRSFIEQNAKSIGCSLTFLLPHYIATAAVSIGRRRWVHLKNSWQEPLIFWLVTIAMQGGGKTPAFIVGAAALRRMHHNIFAEYKKSLAEWLSLSEKHKQAKKLNAVIDLPLGEKPSQPERNWIHECTTERRLRLHARNPNGLALVSDELSGFIKGLNQFKGGAGNDKEKLLSSWSGTPEVIDRQSDGDEAPEYAEYTGLQIAGGTQPDVWQQMMFSEQNDKNGLATRFLPIFPEDKFLPWTDYDVDPTFLAEQITYFNTLRDLPLTVDAEFRAVGVGMPWSDEHAKRTFVDWHNKIGVEAKRIQREDPVFGGAILKLISYASRYAGLVELLNHVEGKGSDQSISQQSVESGIAVVEWHRTEWKRTLGALHEDECDRKRRTLAELIAKKFNGIAKPGDLRAHLEQYRPSGAAEDALSSLAELGLGTLGPPKSTPAGGRPVRTFAMHASVMEQLLSAGGNQQ
jgi:hypothetical protein